MGREIKEKRLNQNKLKQQQELKGCTFKPHTNRKRLMVKSPKLSTMQDLEQLKKELNQSDLPSGERNRGVVANNTNESESLFGTHKAMGENYSPNETSFHEITHRKSMQVDSSIERDASQIGHMLSENPYNIIVTQNTPDTQLLERSSFRTRERE